MLYKLLFYLTIDVVNKNIDLFGVSIIFISG